MFDKSVSDDMSGLEASHAAPPERGMLAINASRIFGANFKRLREALHLSRDQVATSLGLTGDHLARIEAGAQDQVDFELIVLMTKQLNISYDDLTRGLS